MWCTVLIRRGTGTCTTMECMRICSRLPATRCGGTGDGTGVFQDRIGASDSTGDRHGIAAGILRRGMEVIGAEAIGPVTGADTGIIIGAIGVRDGIIILLITDGPEVAGAVRDIRTTVLRDIPIIPLPAEVGFLMADTLCLRAVLLPAGELLSEG